MAAEIFTGKVLFADDSEIMRTMLDAQARVSGLEDYEIFEDAQRTLTRLKELEKLEEIVAAIFTDGLHGDWQKIVAAAKEARVPVVVMSTDKDIQEAVEEAGAEFLDKSMLKPRFIGKILATLQQPPEA